ncbi:hypothetical protein P152DRAFT_158127 [Eremomyces bilateralis CBS 781.70]|uniref:Uncharacterized protein n=1 Tax=Eremomyces bilateralis CBS 781.70 TaxID=1392243 RepID=A0A6G1FUT6_9PEZI|nr:uncharacterized protein P152DRAFT_158127 [Eremomyces bilateralis CBS 781.70]KAF1809468.1 hypothetical protein P152DRAFT_158127 [Eremomyces bilateralis CBS 781.70]
MKKSMFYSLQTVASSCQLSSRKMMHVALGNELEYLMHFLPPPIAVRNLTYYYYYLHEQIALDELYNLIWIRQYLD